jgi:hypothetical protein
MKQMNDMRKAKNSFAYVNVLELLMSEYFMLDNQTELSEQGEFSV